MPGDMVVMQESLCDNDLLGQRRLYADSPADVPGPGSGPARSAGSSPSRTEGCFSEI